MFKKFFQNGINPPAYQVGQSRRAPRRRADRIDMLLIVGTNHENP